MTTQKEMENTTYFVKIFCPHCESITQENISGLIFVPGTVICMECGKVLTGHRRVSKCEGEVRVWIDYR